MASRKRPTLSVVIIALNEEKRLPALFACLKQQTFTNFEMILADAKSTDSSRTIARRAGARIVDGGMPSRGRNAGARASRADVILFLDADVVLDPRFIELNLAAFTKRGLAIGTTYSRPLSGNRLNRVLYGIWNSWLWSTQRIRPHVAGYSLFVRRALFKRVHGFDEGITLAEDIDFVRRASRYGAFGILPVTIGASDRRYVPENRWRTVRAQLLWIFDDWFRPARLRGTYDYALGDHAEQRSSGKRRL